jgi:peroxiredoxin
MIGKAPQRCGILIGVVATLLLADPVRALDVGQKAPGFRLIAPDNTQVTLGDLLGKGPVVMYTIVQAFCAICTSEISGFEGSLPRFEAVNAQVLGVSVDHPETLEAFRKKNNISHPLLSDVERKMLPAYGALVTDAKSPMYRYAKRAYFILDRQGTVRYVRIQANALDPLKPDEVLKALPSIGPWLASADRRHTPYRDASFSGGQRGVIDKGRTPQGVASHGSPPWSNLRRSSW